MLIDFFVDYLVSKLELQQKFEIIDIKIFLCLLNLINLKVFQKKDFCLFRFLSFIILVPLENKIKLVVTFNLKLIWLIQMCK